MSDGPFDLWVADNPMSKKARYVRTRVGPATTGEAATEAFGMSFIADRGPEFLDDDEMDLDLDEIRLFHIRTQRPLEAETTLEEQGINGGDVLVIFPPADTNDDDADFIALISSQGFPTEWSKQIPVDVGAASARELREYEERAEDREERAADRAVRAQPGTTNYVIQFGDHAVVSNSFMSAETIQESFNSLSETNISVELRDELGKLHEAVADLLRAAGTSPEDSEAVAADLEALTQEASRPNPRPAFWRKAAGGLLSVAKQAGAAGTSVLVLVNGVTALLAG